MQLALQFVDLTVNRLNLSFQLVDDAARALSMRFGGRALMAHWLHFVDGWVVLVGSVVFVMPRPRHSL